MAYNNMETHTEKQQSHEKCGNCLLFHSPQTKNAYNICKWLKQLKEE